MEHGSLQDEFPLNIDITLDRKLSTSVTGKPGKPSVETRPGPSVLQLFETRPDRQQRFDAVPRGPLEKALVC